MCTSLVPFSVYGYATVITLHFVALYFYKLIYDLLKYFSWTFLCYFLYFVQLSGELGNLNLPCQIHLILVEEIEIIPTQCSIMKLINARTHTFILHCWCGSANQSLVLFLFIYFFVTKADPMVNWYCYVSRVR
jgi:hypothetical protein